MNDPIIKDLPLFKYISKGNTNKYYFGNNTNNIYLIEIFSGNISAEFKGSTKAISNKRFFNASNDNNLTIYGNEDSFYSIYDYSNKYINDNKFIVGSNYFLELKSGENKTIKLLDCNYYRKNQTSYYLGIYSPEGDINLKFENPSNNQEIKQLKKNNYTQIILPSNLSYNFFLSNEIENINNIKVLLYNFDQNYGISLTNGFLQPFLFNKDDTLIFSYPHTEKDKYISINFQLKQKEKYIVKIRLNNNEYKIHNNNEYNISSDNKNILIKPSDIQKGCGIFIHICKVLLVIKSNSDNLSVLYISINTIKEKRADDNQSEIEKSIILGFLFTFLGGLFIMIIFVILNIKDLLKAIQTTDLEIELIIN